MARHISGPQSTFTAQSELYDRCMLKSLRSYLSDIISSCFPESGIRTWKLQQFCSVRKAQQQSESFQVLRVSIKRTQITWIPQTASLSLSGQPSKTNSNPLSALSDSTRGIIGAVIDYNRFPRSPQLLRLVYPCCPTMAIEQEIC